MERPENDARREATPAGSVILSGRVEKGPTMPCPHGQGRCVVATTWSQSRQFPRMAATAVPFTVNVESCGALGVDLGQASVSLAVRHRKVSGAGGVDEASWISPGDAIVLEGMVDEE